MIGLEQTHSSNERLTPCKMRRFFLIRTEDETGVSGTGRVAEGIEFSSGVCILSWLTEVKSIAAIYANIDTLIEIHGHGGKTVIEFVDE